MTRTPRMAEVIKAIESSNQVVADRAFDNLINLATNRGRILNNSYGISTLNPLSSSIRHYRNNTIALSTIPEFEHLKKPVIRAAFELAIQNNVTNQSFNNGTTNIFEVLALNDRLIFKNPRAGNRLQSWGKFTDANVQYHQAHATRAINKSIFNTGLNISQYCIETIRHGIGHISSSSKFYLYKKFDHPIGLLAINRNPTNFVKVQCDRRHRNSGRGYKTEYHGYPISEEEVRNSFQGLNALFRQL